MVCYDIFWSGQFRAGNSFRVTWSERRSFPPVRLGIDREGFGKHRTGTRQALSVVNSCLPLSQTRIHSRSFVIYPILKPWVTQVPSHFHKPHFFAALNLVVVPTVWLWINCPWHSSLTAPIILRTVHSIIMIILLNHFIIFLFISFVQCRPSLCRKGNSCLLLLIVLALFVLYWIIPDSLIFKPLRLLLAKNGDEMSKRSIQGKRFSSVLILIVQSFVMQYGTVKWAEKACYWSVLQHCFIRV